MLVPCYAMHGAILIVFPPDFYTHIGHTCNCVYGGVRDDGVDSGTNCISFHNCQQNKCAFVSWHAVYSVAVAHCGM